MKAEIIICLSLGIILGSTICSYVHRPPTWSEIISAMPPKMKEDIALDYCVAHKRMCKIVPLKSPIEPMDGRLK
jgi:hypothetical protein